MIRTKDLEEYIKSKFKESSPISLGYSLEIIKRLREYDSLQKYLKSGK